MLLKVCYKARGMKIGVANAILDIRIRITPQCLAFSWSHCIEKVLN